MTGKRLALVIEKYSAYPEFLGIDITDLNQHGAVGSTMLHIAAWNGALEDMEVLIQSGADVNSTGDMGNTPLHNAAMKGRIEAVRLLLEAGADPKRKNEDGNTPFRVAELGKHKQVVELLAYVLKRTR